MTSCGAVVGGRSLDSVDVSKQAVIQGVVQRGGQPAPVGYVRLLDKQDEFVAEVPISTKGEFRFFATTGDWTLVTLLPGGTSRLPVKATVGQITDIEVAVG